MPAEPDICGAFPLLLSLDFKFMNSFEETHNYFETHHKASSCSSNRFIIDHQRVSLSAKGYEKEREMLYNRRMKRKECYLYGKEPHFVRLRGFARSSF